MKKYNIKKIDISLWALLLSLLTVLYINVYFSNWNEPKRIIVTDVLSYYAYLPAAFVYNDISLESIKNKGETLGGGFYGKISPTGKTVIITSSGMSMLYFPFFIIAHPMAQIMGYKADGYSPPYKFALVLSSMFYLLLGAVFLRKFLLKYFSTVVVAITLFVVIITTNLLWYVTFEAPMTHVYSFALISIFLYVIDNWLEKPMLKYTIAIGLLVGIISLIRPTNVTVVILLIFWKITSWNEFKERIFFFLGNWHNILIMLTLFFIVWSPQLLYWKYVTGNYFYYSYPNNQGFYFLNPQLFNTFFSWRKGLFIYTPVMIFAIIGIGLLYKVNKKLFLPVVIYFFVTWYIISSWWDWWYGGSFGLRAYIDLYGVYSIGMAAFLTWLFKKQLTIKISLITIFILLSTLSTWNYVRYYYGSIHWVAMTKEAYFECFWRKHPTKEYYSKLRNPDYKLARKGIYKYEDESQAEK